MARLSEAVRTQARKALLEATTLRAHPLSDEEASKVAQAVFDRFQGQISGRDFLILFEREARKLGI